ncbi:competence protein ComK [Oceanobacillus bengalensis]|uniref:Competence protein n=1 Tax=Oceanobacillus bengalensis TaxID=1435466 RepID=A0A494Z8A9_9BACI|nr:competence protein ComK [Oceanobacillus bengalensis]RKQ18825.1 competence protein [Oceanobacillus bengalensis]
MTNYLDFPDYEMNPLTLAIVAEQDSNGELISKVLEEDMEYVVESTPLSIIEYSCKFFGSSLKGRQEGSRDICGISNKIPIAIDPSSGMYFFPTASPNNSKCSWIAHSHIDKIKKIQKHSTEFIFKNGNRIVLDVSYGSMLNQVQRTAQYRYLLDNRIRILQQQKGEMVAESYS